MKMFELGWDSNNTLTQADGFIGIFTGLLKNKYV